MTQPGFSFFSTTVEPIVAQDYYVRPPAYDIFENTPATNEPYADDIKDPRDYPYMQYQTKLNLLPRQERNVKLFCNGLAPAREYVYSLYTMNDIAFRENVTRILKKKMKQRYRHDCMDTWSPYNDDLYIFNK